MNKSLQAERGVTLLELVVVVAIVAILGTVVLVNVTRARPRATLLSATTDLQGLIHGARQAALASGHDVIVMLFPERAENRPPRVVVIEDPSFAFMSGGGALDFDGYDPEVLAYPEGGRVEYLDLPAGVEVGPATGLGSALPEPLNAIDVGVACSFCSTDSSNDRRGAIRFDSRGAATFYSENGTKRPSGVGASFTVTDRSIGQRNTFVILSSTGLVQVEQQHL